MHYYYSLGAYIQWWPGALCHIQAIACSDPQVAGVPVSWCDNVHSLPADVRRGA